MALQLLSVVQHRVDHLAVTWTNHSKRDERRARRWHTVINQLHRHYAVATRRVNLPTIGSLSVL
jgi:hypothetical protein